MSFKNPSWPENSLYSYVSSSLCPPLPPSLIWIFWMYSQNFITRDLWSLEVIFSLCLWLLAHTYSSWKFLKLAFKSVWNVWPEMSSTAFFSFVNSKMTQSLFPVSVTPMFSPSPPLFIRIKSWEALCGFSYFIKFCLRA